MKKRNIIILLIMIILISIIIIANLNKRQKSENDNIKIVTSFYPIYIMTLNITDGLDEVEVKNMAETHNGCIHDYTLLTSDLKEFEDADIYIENGKGIEKFSNKIIDSYPNINVIEVSENINDVILEENNINAHFWTSIDNYILQVQHLTNRLKELDKKNSLKYEENSLKYVEKLQHLKNEYREKTKHLENKKVVSLNESFSYLLKFIGMNELLISSNHEQNSMSAEMIKNVIEQINKEHIEAIIIEEKDNKQNANTIKSETNAKIYELKDAMSGDGSLNSYIDNMKENLKVLSQIE